jgi:hypothetical protein
MYVPYRTVRRTFGTVRVLQAMWKKPDGIGRHQRGIRTGLLRWLSSADRFIRSMRAKMTAQSHVEEHCRSFIVLRFQFTPCASCLFMSFHLTNPRRSTMDVVRDRTCVALLFPILRPLERYRDRFIPISFPDVSRRLIPSLGDLILSMLCTSAYRICTSEWDRIRNPVVSHPSYSVLRTSSLVQLYPAASLHRCIAA